MPRNKKRTAEEYEKEIEQAAKRMRKKKEHLASARNSDTWLEFLENIGVGTTETEQGQDFWEKVRIDIIGDKISSITDRMTQEAREPEKIIKYNLSRQVKYHLARYYGVSSKEARAYRDYSQERISQELGFENWNKLLGDIYK